jgi:hypothetical protein
MAAPLLLVGGVSREVLPVWTPTSHEAEMWGTRIVVGPGECRSSACGEG